MGVVFVLMHEETLMSVKNKKQVGAGYEKDDGPLTAEQLEQIRSASSATKTPEELFTEKLS